MIDILQETDYGGKTNSQFVKNGHKTRLLFTTVKGE